MTKQLFDSYITNIQLFVQINDIRSNVITTNIDVPQGWVLGPLLYNIYIYINDLHKCTNNFDIINYADDTTLISTINQFDNYSTGMNDNINNIYIIYMLSVYSPFSDRVGLPLHNTHIPSLFTSIMDIFFVDLKFGHIRFLHSLTMSFLVFQPIFCLQLYTPYHLSLSLLMKVVIGSTPTSPLNSSFVLLSFNEIPHIHLIICISALSNFNPTSTSKGI